MKILFRGMIVGILLLMVCTATNAQYKRPSSAKASPSTELEKPTMIPEEKPVLLKREKPKAAGADKLPVESRNKKQEIRKAEAVVEEKKVK